jgi:hypothetical protein
VIAHFIPKRTTGLKSQYSGERRRYLPYRGMPRSAKIAREYYISALAEELIGDKQ